MAWRLASIAPTNRLGATVADPLDFGESFERGCLVYTVEFVDDGHEFLVDAPPPPTLRPQDTLGGAAGRDGPDQVVSIQLLREDVVDDLAARVAVELLNVGITDVNVVSPPP